MISNITKNCMGTTDFDGKFNGMRKAQSFIVYGMESGQTEAKIQSSTRLGLLCLDTGRVEMSTPRANGAGFAHFSFDRFKKITKFSQITEEERIELRDFIKGTGGDLVGSVGILSVNTGASQL